MANTNLVRNVVKTTTSFTKKNSSAILTTVSLFGLVGTTVLAIKATPSANYALQLAEKKKGEKLNPWDVTQAVWKAYLPTFAVGVATSVSIIATHKINMNRQVALMSAYTMADQALKKYQEKAIEMVGPKKEESIRVAAKEEQFKSDTQSPVIIPGGSFLCRDCMSGQLFRSDIDSIKRTISKLNARLHNEDTVSYGEYYYELGLEANIMSDLLEWDIVKGEIIADYIYGQHNGEPCLFIELRQERAEKFWEDVPYE